MLGIMVCYYFTVTLDYSTVMLSASGRNPLVIWWVGEGGIRVHGRRGARVGGG